MSSLPENDPLATFLVEELKCPLPVVALDCETQTLARDHQYGWDDVKKFGVACCVVSYVALQEDLGPEPVTSLGFVDDVSPWALEVGAQGHLPIPRGLVGVVNLDRLAWFVNERLRDGGTFIGWNIIGFDRLVLEGHFQREKWWPEDRIWRDEPPIKFVDLMKIFHGRLGWRPHLDATSLANGGPRKSLNAVEAPGMWRRGEKNKVLEYCAGDVDATLHIARQWFREGGSVTIPSNYGPPRILRRDGGDE